MRWWLWLPLLFLLAWLLSQFVKERVWWLEWGVACASLLAVFAAHVWVSRLTLKKNRPSPSFLAGLVDIATMRRLESPILLLTGVVLLGYLINLMTELNFLGLLVSFAMLMLTVEIVWLADLHTSYLPPSSKLVPTPGLILFASRLGGNEKDNLCSRISSSDNPQIWQDAIRRAGELYKQVAEKFRKDKKSFTLPDVSKTVAHELGCEAKAYFDYQKNIWEFIASCPPAIVAALRSVDYHAQDNLKFVWSIVTDEAAGFFEVFEILVKKAFPGVSVLKKELQDPNDPANIQKVVNEVYQEAASRGLSEDQVTTDITGGTAIMSVGGALACVRSRRRLQYLRQDTFQFIAVPVTIQNIKQAIDELLDQLPELLQSSRSERQ
ncbi:MAG: hypothetical protein NZ959_08570 [Armatimonadetes bacterium]|nr:hypothetical protein [Armatimonadota bacterium]MDW8121708.1 hypothetical protein [Armatimonadota bacterium]